MKNNLLKLIVGICFAFQAIGQNPTWIIPSNYYDGINPLPLPTPTFMFGDPAYPIGNDIYRGYIGQLPTNASNIISNAQGEIEFFIVDDLVYDKNGDYIHQLTNENGEAVKGASEIVVIPNPTNCEQYYIVSTLVESGSYYKIPYVFLLDMSILNPNAYNTNNCASYGAFIEMGSGSYPWGLSINSISNGAFELYDQISSKKSNIFIAGSDLTANNERLVFISNGQGIHRFKIGASGFLYENAFIPFPNPEFNPERSRSEMELIKLPNNNFRIATPYVTTGTVTGNSINGYSIWQNLYTAELDQNGNLIPSTVKVFPLNKESVNSIGYYAAFKGVEFSQDGRFLYVTHSTNTIDTNPFEYYDFNNPTSDLMPITVGGGINLRYSMLELGANNALYMANENGLYKMSTNASIPSGTLQSVFSFSNTATHEGPIVDINKKMYMLQDQIDGMDYSVYQFANQQCCLDNKFFHADIKYNVINTAVWQNNAVSGGSNPLITGNGNIIYIKKELRVKAGATLTIKNMIIQFAPGARLVVENSPTSNGQGGKLILDGTTLTVDGRCNPNAMWLGVEVWGNQTLTQGTWLSSSQGRFEMLNNSKIEHAWVGTLVSKRQTSITEICPGSYEEVISTFAFDNARNGGIVKASGKSVFYNNQRGVQFRPYFGPNGIAGPNNLSTFSDVTFEWFGPLKEASYQDHARLDEVKGISFKGCGFYNNTTQNYSSVPIGRGINARESQFYVTPLCNSFVPIGQTCPGEIPNTFKNLQYGILTTNANVLSFTCDKNLFKDNQYGIFVFGTKGEKVTSNDFAVRESDQFQTAGLAMFSSSGYKVENNTFYEFDNSTITNGDALSFGIVVNNSGPVKNDIYRNYFHDLRIGGQTEKVNAVQITTLNDPTSTATFTMSGLNWSCNDFQKDIYKHDMTLMSGRMHFHQGEASGGATLLEAKKRVAGNKFSLTNEPTVNMHDIFVSDNSQRFVYSYFDAPRFKPDSYTFQNYVSGNLVNNTVNIDQMLWNGYIVTDPAGTCPSKLISKTPVLVAAQKTEIKERIEELKGFIDGGNTLSLINLINTASDGQVKSALMAASPYLSDDVLLAYIATNPPIGNLKQIILANSQLSAEVKTALLNVNMPSGSANQIAAAQAGYSARTKLWFEISFLQGQYDEIYNEQYRDLLLNETENANFNELIQLLKEEQDEERLKLLFSTYVIVDDTIKATETRDQLILNQTNTDLIAFTNIQKSTMGAMSTCNALALNSNYVNELQSLKLNATDKIIACKAMCMLRTIEDTFDTPLFLMPSNSLQLSNQSENESTINLNRIFLAHIYPNPSSGNITIDYPELETGDLEIQVLDINGRNVATFKSVSNSNSDVINLEFLDKGIYMLQLYMNGQFVENHKVVLK